MFFPRRWRSKWKIQRNDYKKSCIHCLRENKIKIFETYEENHARIDGMKLFIPLFETHARYLKQIQRHLFENSLKGYQMSCACLLVIQSFCVESNNGFWYSTINSENGFLGLQIKSHWKLLFLVELVLYKHSVCKDKLKSRTEVKSKNIPTSISQCTLSPHSPPSILFISIDQSMQ